MPIYIIISYHTSCFVFRVIKRRRLLLAFIRPVASHAPAAKRMHVRAAHARAKKRPLVVVAGRDVHVRTR
jgi:hypothetical protein